MNETTHSTASTESGAPPPSALSLAIQGLNTREAIARFAGDEDRYRYWLTEFITHGPASTAQIRQAITNGSKDTAIKLAHALKGRTGMLGMIQLHSIAMSLEKSLKDGEQATLWIEELERSTHEMSQELSVALGQPKA